MIRARATDGKLYALKDNVRFVEICDDNGGLAAVVYVNALGVVRVITPGDSEFSRYVKTYAPKVTRVADI